MPLPKLHPLLVSLLLLALPLGGLAQSMPARDAEKASASRPLNLSLPHTAPGQVRMGPQGRPNEPQRQQHGGLANGQAPQQFRNAGEMRYGMGYEARQSGAAAGHGPGAGAGQGRGR